jgi:hypothetical protein
MNCTKIILIVLIICSCSVTSAQLKDQLSLKQNSSLFIDTNKNVTKLSEKSPLLSGMLSFVVPGFAVGKFYNEQISKFFIHSLISTGLILSFISLHGKFSNINIFGNIFSNERTITIGSIAFMLAFSTNWIWSIVDAVGSAKEINKQVLLQKYRSDKFNRFQFGLTSDGKKTLKFKFAINL